MTTEEFKNQADRLSDVLSDTFAYAVNEARILAQLEEFLDPKPPKLAISKEQADILNKSIDALIREYGGPPLVIIQGINEQKPRYDTYLTAALDEVMRLFDRSRNSLCRARAFQIGMEIFEKEPNILKIPKDAPPEVQSLFSIATSNAFWEHAEACYIRLASYWDRVGQVLDFAFFGIRQYERDGFSAVMERIRANTLEMHPDIGNLEAWKVLLKYKNSEKEDGMKWLFTRRNMLIHSLSLRAAEPERLEELYESAYNHLNSRYRKRLAVGTPKVEISRLYVHLASAANLLPSIIEVCQSYAPHSPVRSEP